jgi:hypothetical protein
MKCFADVCEDPMVCTAVGQSSGTCVMPIAAGGSCKSTGMPCV